MKTGVFFLVSILCFFFSCTKQSDPAGIEIRVFNSTPFQIDSISISGADKQIAFSSLNPGFTTGYRMASAANLHPACSVYVHQQSDPYYSADGEVTLMNNASYTCQVKYVNDSIVVKFIKE